MSKNINLCIVGLGNCASSLLQGIAYYSDPNNEADGLMLKDIGPFSISSIQVPLAFDVDSRKVGRAIEDAIWLGSNCTKKFCDVENKNMVENAPLFDGVAPHMVYAFGVDVYSLEAYNELAVDHMGDWDSVKSVAGIRQLIIQYADRLKKKEIDVLISYLPVGSYHASRFWAEVCLQAGVSFVNAIPEFICSDVEWGQRFKEAGIVCAGDDIKSQVGATIIHRVLTALIDERGQNIENTYQLNVGGNTDFQNMTDENRLKSKRVSKTEAVVSASNQNFATKIGPSDFIPHLKDNKVCYINFKGTQFGGIPFELDLKLSVEDSPNSAGCMIDVIRLVKLAKDRGLSGYQDFSSYYFKHPLKQIPENISKKIVHDFIS